MGSNIAGCWIHSAPYMDVIKMDKIIRKLSFWRNKTPIQAKPGEPRWDVNIWFEDGTQTRETKIAYERALELLEALWK